MREAVVAALRDAVPDLADDVADRVEVTPPREASLGDMATNAALLAAKPARQPPAKLAAAIAERLRGVPAIAEATVAGPGFINLRLHPAALRAVLPAVLRGEKPTATAASAAACAVNVEYVSANPTGPMHIGHCRGAVVGDALANLLAKAGFAVTKEYYINDAGAQVTALAWAAYWRYLQAIGTRLSEEQFSEEVPGGLQYRGEYLIPIGEATRRRIRRRPRRSRRRGRRAARLARHRARLHHRADDARTSARTWRCSASPRMCSFLGTFPGRVGRGGRDDRLARRARADLRGHAGAAQGQDAGRLGAAPADAVPRHPVRRRRRPAAAQVGRLATPISPTTSPITATRSRAASPA